MARPVGTINKRTLEKIEVIKETFQKEGCLTVRRIYYILLSKGLLTHKESTYISLSSQLTQWREKGIIDPDTIIDQHRILDKLLTYNSLNEFLDDAPSHYILDTQENQPVYLETWAEKDTLHGIVADICHTYRIPLVISKGFTSYSFKHEALKRFSEINKPVQMLYLGDWDAEGLYIPQLLQEFLARNGSEIKLDRVAMVERDIKSLPSIAWHPSTLHLKKEYVSTYVKNYGKTKWEIEALSFKEIRDRLLDSISKYVDIDKLKKTRRKEQKERELLAQRLQKFMRRSEIA